MELAGKHIVVTGAAGGIGAALIRRFADEGPRGLVAVDRAADPLEAVAGETGATPLVADLGRQEDVLRVIEEATAAHGPVDVFYSNAGVAPPAADAEATDLDWDVCWRVNVMAHAWAARALVPQMLERGEGYLINTASAAGLLMTPGHMAYSVTKHAAVSLAECLAVAYGDRGIRVSCLCPQVVDTAMFDAVRDEPEGRALLETGSVLQPAEVAEQVLESMREERFLILTHPEIVTYAQRRATDHDRWVRGMRRLRARNAAAA
jgi:NAD(P)-dependent dehydrogenase (short-subunit alcohol dehydrogenase family)